MPATIGIFTGMIDGVYTEVSLFGANFVETRDARSEGTRNKTIFALLGDPEPHKRGLAIRPWQHADLWLEVYTVRGEYPGDY